MKKQELSSLHHCVFSLTYHLVLTTKYRRKVITNEMLTRLRKIFDETLEKWDCQLIEFNGEVDHVHLLLNATPNPQLSVLVNNLKTVYSRLIRRSSTKCIGNRSFGTAHIVSSPQEERRLK